MGGRSGRTRILVVDDDALVRRALAVELEQAFELVEASGYEQALGLLRGADPFEAVVSDLRLGRGPSGIELLAESRRRNPFCGRILLSGSFVGGEQDHLILDGIAHRCVAKPWQPGAVSSAVRSAIDEARPTNRPL